MNNEFTLETCYKVFDDEEGACIQIGTSPDAPEYVHLSTPTKIDKDWYGDIDVVLHPKQAKFIGEALIKLANEINVKDEFK